MSRTKLSVLALLALPALGLAATSGPSVPSVFGGNGHNASFDGRLYLVRDHVGWQAFVLRPEGVTFRPDGLPDATGPVWSSPMMVVSGEPNGECARDLRARSSPRPVRVRREQQSRWDFVHTGIDRRPSPFYDREIDARARRLDAINAGEEPELARFGPLQPL